MSLRLRLRTEFFRSCSKWSRKARISSGVMSVIRIVVGALVTGDWRSRGTTGRRPGNSHRPRTQRPLSRQVLREEGWMSAANEGASAQGALLIAGFRVLAKRSNLFPANAINSGTR